MEPLLTIPEAIRLNPEDAAAYNNRGIIKKKRGDLDGAIADYTGSDSPQS